MGDCPAGIGAIDVHLARGGPADVKGLIMGYHQGKPVIVSDGFNWLLHPGLLG